MGRPRKFRLSQIVSTLTDSLRSAPQKWVIVDHRVRGTKSEYRIVPLSGNNRRFGQAAWVESNQLADTGLVSSNGSVLTYRANEELERELPEGRGCACQCCIHTAIPRGDFNNQTGVMR